MLPSMHSNEGDQLQLDLYLQSSQGSAQGRSYHRVCELWMHWLFIRRLGEKKECRGTWKGMIPGQRRFGSRSDDDNNNDICVMMGKLEIDSEEYAWTMPSTHGKPQTTDFQYASPELSSSSSRIFMSPVGVGGSSVLHFIFSVRTELMGLVARCFLSMLCLACRVCFSALSDRYDASVLPLSSRARLMPSRRTAKPKP